MRPLVFVRPGELRMAEWAEFNLDEAEWRIPAERMKARVQHIVPLSTQAVAILRELQPFSGSARFLFPSVRTPARPMSNNTLNAALRRLGYTTDDQTATAFDAWRARYSTSKDGIVTQLSVSSRTASATKCVRLTTTRNIFLTFRASHE